MKIRPPEENRRLFHIADSECRIDNSQNGRKYSQYGKRQPYGNIEDCEQPACPKTQRTALTGIAEGLFSKVQMRCSPFCSVSPKGFFRGGADKAGGFRGWCGAPGTDPSRFQRHCFGSSARTPEIYSANRESPIFKELHGLIMKTVGLSQPLRDALEPFAHRIKYAFIYGSTARGDDTAASDVDLMIIGDELAYPEVLAALLPVEQAIGGQ
jgi:hypothetical protein